MRRVCFSFTLCLESTPPCIHWQLHSTALPAFAQYTHGCLFLWKCLPVFYSYPPCVLSYLICIPHPYHFLPVPFPPHSPLPLSISGPILSYPVLSYLSYPSHFCSLHRSVSLVHHVTHTTSFTIVTPFLFVTLVYTRVIITKHLAPSKYWGPHFSEGHSS